MIDDLWIGYNLPTDPLPSTFSSRDPLRFSFITRRIANEYIPDITNQTCRAAYFKLMALTGHDAIKKALKKFNADPVEHILLLERAWTIGLFYTESLTGSDTNAGVYGVRRARQLARTIDIWKKNYLRENDAILSNQLGTGGYGYYHRAFDSLGLGRDNGTKPSRKFIKAVIGRKKNPGKVIGALINPNITLKTIENIKWALERLTEWVPIKDYQSSEANQLLRDYLLGNPQRRKVFNLYNKETGLDEYMIIEKLASSSDDIQGKACKSVLYFEKFIQKCLRRFILIAKSTITGETDYSNLKLQSDAKNVLRSLSSINQLPNKEDPFTTFLNNIVKEVKDINSLIINYHVEAQKAKRKSPWIVWDEDEKTPKRNVTEISLKNWIQRIEKDLENSKKNGTYHKYRTEALVSLINDLGG